MTDNRGHIEHHPIIGMPAENITDRAVVIFDAATGVQIGASPHITVEQVSVDKSDDIITTTLKIRRFKG